MWFKYGLKAQKLLAQGVWGETCETSVFQRKANLDCIPYPGALVGESA